MEAHTTPMRRDDVTPHTSFPLVLNALQAKWKWLRTWWSLSGFVKLEHGAIWAEQHSTKQYLPLHNDYSEVPEKATGYNQLISSPLKVSYRGLVALEEPVYKNGFKWFELINV